MSVRESTGGLYSFNVWLLLFKMVLEKFDQKLRMAEILTMVLKPNNESMANNIFKYFVDAYGYRDRTSKTDFLRCREAAIQMLAVQFVDHLRAKQEEMDKFIIYSFRSETFKNEAALVFNEFIAMADRITPCEGSLVCPDGREVRCTQEKLMHGPVHRTSERVYAGLSEDKLARVFENMSGWLRIGYRPTWPGMHSFSYTRSDNEELEKFRENTELLSQTLGPSSYFLTKISILQKMMLGVKDVTKANNTQYCWICIKNYPDKVLEPCGHVFCSACVTLMLQLLEDQVSVSLKQDTDEPYGVLQKEHCPLCSKPYTAVRENTSLRTRMKLVNRFNALLKTDLRFDL